MPSTYPGFSVVEISEATQALITQKPQDIVLVTTRSTAGSAASNVPTLCASTTELTARIGTVPAVTTASFERIRAIAPNARIWIIAGLDPATTPTATQNLIAGLNSILRASTLPLAIVIVPEAATMANQSDRTSISTAAETVVATNGFDFLYFGNFGLTTDTKAKADTEAALYPSAQGNSSYWWGFEKDSSNRDVPVCVAAAAWQINLLQNLDGFYPPAGTRTALGTVDPRYVPSLDDATAIMNVRGSYNFVWSTGGANYLWNDSTRSSDEGWMFINSRLALSTVQGWANDQLGGLQFTPADPNPDSEGLGATTREFIGRMSEVGERSRTQGAIVDYRVNVLPITAGTASIEFRVRPIRSTRFIRLAIINTQTP